MNRTANRPGSQHIARFRNFGLVATVCRFPRAADGDRPRSEGVGSWSRCMRKGERGKRKQCVRPAMPEISDPAGLFPCAAPALRATSIVITPYPAQPRERDRWIVAHRTRTNQLDPFRPHAFLLEQERAESGEAVSVATIFLTNRECPWRCLMCDLWKNTLPETVPPGAIPAQIDHALAELKGGARVADTLSGNSGDSASAEGRSLTPDVTSIRQVKLYNSGSFFDPRAIPPEEHAEIAQ